MSNEDLAQYQTWPFETVGPAKALEPPVEVEPPRRGEGGIDCFRCENPYERAAWHDERWVLTRYEPSPFLGVVLLQPLVHIESIADLPPDLAAEFGPMVGRVQRAIESLGGIGRVHVNYWGDGGAHLHVWFYPRPYGQLQLRGTFFPVWGFTLPDRPIEESQEAGRRIAAAMDASA
ncbi:MAG TPA: hypothetical protein VK906_05265 [Egicoccus sp.]|nr:hypothetical protein [Egicoccus sp.]HSK22561.1 hypothetical protein [Egicoccus sp.]